MPFYSFDPQDEGEDWEAELLEEGLTHRPNPANKVGSSSFTSFPYYNCAITRDWGLAVMSRLRTWLQGSVHRRGTVMNYFLVHCALHINEVAKRGPVCWAPAYDMYS